MSELLLRGWNVAVPVVDVGDDVFVIDDEDKTTYRVQAKSTWADDDTGRITARFKLKRSQLRAAQPIELFYILLVRHASVWRFLVIPRTVLSELHSRFLRQDRSGPGRPPLSDEEARSDDLALEVQIDGTSANAWNQSMTEFLDVWPDELGLRELGPGRRGR